MTATAMLARTASGSKLRAIPNTAWATTATAAAFSPMIHPALLRSPAASTPAAKMLNTITEGRVKPMKAAHMPANPARRHPNAMPTCDDAGPGRNWHRATKSA